MSKIINEGSFKDLVDKGIEILKKNPEWENVSNRRNSGHIYGVKKFAEKISKEYPKHDNDKFEELKIPYIFLTLGYNPDYKDKLDLIKEMEDFVEWAKYEHLINNPHHPEYWDKETTIYNSNNKDNTKPIDATKMDDESLIEMCCDWASIGSENGNSPQVWFKKGYLEQKWLFTEHQVNLINKTLEELWPGGSDETAKIDHEERYFNNDLWDKLTTMWEEYERNIDKEELDVINEFLNKHGDITNEELLLENLEFDKMDTELSMLHDEKQEWSKIANDLYRSKFEPVVKFNGINSIQDISFLFSQGVTGFIQTLLDSAINGKGVSEIDLRRFNLDKIGLGSNKTTDAKVTSNFARAIERALNKVANSKINTKIKAVKAIIKELKKNIWDIKDKEERKEYIEDLKSLRRIVKVVNNIIKNRNNFINVIKKSLSLQESNELIESDPFVNIYDGL